jgi:hypothetical protein
LLKYGRHTLTAISVYKNLSLASAPNGFGNRGKSSDPNVQIFIPFNSFGDKWFDLGVDVLPALDEFDGEWLNLDVGISTSLDGFGDR